MPVTARLTGTPTLTRTFTCAQWDTMPAGNLGWSELVRDCVGEDGNSRRPYAEVVLQSPAVDMASLDPLTYYEDDAAAIADGLLPGDEYRLTANNPYGMKYGSRVTVE